MKYKYMSQEKEELEISSEQQLDKDKGEGKSGKIFVFLQACFGIGSVFFMVVWFFSKGMVNDTALLLYSAVTLTSLNLIAIILGIIKKQKVYIGVIFIILTILIYIVGVSMLCC